MLPDFERAGRIGEFWGYPQSRAFAELLIDCEEDRTLRAVLVGMLREDESREQPWPFEAVLHYEDECPGAPRASRGAGLIWLAECEDEAMTLAKRRLGRRLAGAGVAAASLMLGLEAPAFATSPTISSFSPTSGPAGCVVVITGTNFKDPIVTSVDIGGTPVSEFKVVSVKEIWATVAGDTGGTIHVTNASATASSPSDFTNANPGGCSPTITFVTPCGGGGGPRGTVVTIVGTNLLKSSGTATTAAIGGDVRFAPYTATATHTGAPETPKQLSVVVPPDAIDGSIRVSTFNDVLGEGAVLGATFIVPPPDLSCSPADHARSITLSLGSHLVAQGRVSSFEDPAFTDCVASVPVKIQRRVSGRWGTVGRTTTTDTGVYKKRIKDRPGKYRSVAPSIVQFNDLCFRAVSSVRRYNL